MSRGVVALAIVGGAALACSGCVVAVVVVAETVGWWRRRAREARYVHALRREMERTERRTGSIL